MTQPCGGLLTRARRGDEQAWDELVRTYSRLLTAIAGDFRLGPEEGADAAQMTWLRLVENSSKVREPEKLKAWLSSTMRRECIRLVNRRRAEQPTDEWTDADFGISESPEATVLRAERDAGLWSAVERLPRRQREVLLALMADEPRSYEQLSAELRLTIGAIGPTRQRALRSMRALLTQGSAPTRAAGEFDPDRINSGPCRL